MLDTLKSIAVRTAGLSLVIAVFAVIAVLVPSDTVTRWVGLVGFAAVMAGAGWWSSGDARSSDLNTSLRDWLVVSFLLAVGWWVALILVEGERDVIERLSIDFWSVLATVGLVFASALVGALVGRAAARAADPS